MKISSASKKVLASALSAAMVVAFAPTVAFGAVVSDGTSSAVDTPAVSGDAVATVTYYTAKNGNYAKHVQEFKATDAKSYDNAVQAAVAYASNSYAKLSAVSGDSKHPVTVQLQKDVQVAAPFYGTSAAATVSTDDTTAAETASPILIGGTFTLDLNGHTLSSDGAVALKSDSTATVTDAFADEVQTKTVKVFSTEAATATQVENGTSNASVVSAVKANLAIPTGFELVDDASLTAVPKSTVLYKEGTGSTHVDGVSGKTYVQDGSGTYYEYEVTYKVKKEVVEDALGDTNVTITDSAEKKGAVSASKRAAINAAGTVTIDGAVVSAENAGNAIYGSAATIKLAHNATVTNAVKGYVEFGANKKFDAGTDSNDIAAITAKDVEVVAPTAAELAANEYAAYDKGATVTATITDGETAEADKVATATAISVSGAYTANRNAEVTASAEAAASKGDATVDGDTGIVDPVAYKENSASTAVKGASTVKYGTYTGDYAIDGAATIDYGTFNGWVASGTANGGKFKYTPEDEAKVKDVVKQAKLTTTDKKVAKGKDAFYVYRMGTVLAEQNNTADKITVAKPEKAEQADLASYLQATYLKSKTESEVTSESDLGKALTDNNRAAAEGTLNIQFTEDYANPYSEKDRAANADAFKAIDAQAEANTQHVNGVYKVTGQLFYDKVKNANGTRTSEAAKFGEALTSLDGTELSIKVKPVTVDSKAKLYSISGTATSEVASKTQDAVAAGAMSYLKASTDKLGTFGVTYSTAEDLQKEAEANKGETPAVAQTLYTAFSKKTVKAKTLKKKAVTLKIKGQAANAVTYKVTKKASKKIAVSKKGVVTMKKGAKKGTYKVSVTAAAGNGLAAAKKTVTIVVK